MAKELPGISGQISNKTDLHVFHFRTSPPLGGDIDAIFTPREIVDWVERFRVFDRFVLGNHPPAHFRIKTELSPEEYLDAITASVNRLQERFHGRIFSGVECDFLLPEPGKVDFNPGEALLSRYNPDVSLIAFHFHSSLIYGKRYEISTSELAAALKWAISSGMFSIIAHPFDVLGRLHREDRASFEEVANMARDCRVAIEINADKGFGEKPLSALVENGNFFSFGGDFHALSYWLKRDPKGISATGADRALVEQILGLVREASDKEKRYWAELDPLFWKLTYSSKERGDLRSYAVRLYRRLWDNPDAFKRGLKKVGAHFNSNQRALFEDRLRDLQRIYAKWEGPPTKQERSYVEKRYLLQVPLTLGEIGIYEQWLQRAFDLGLKKERLINAWSSPDLESFLRR